MILAKYPNNNAKLQQVLCFFNFVSFLNCHFIFLILIMKTDLVLHFLFEATDCLPYEQSQMLQSKHSYHELSEAQVQVIRG